MLAICASHSPLMLTDIESTDAKRQQDFEHALAGAAQSLAAFDPQLVVVFGPDHFNGLFFDLMPAFCVGLAAQSTEDWGLAPEHLDVPADLAPACVRALYRRGFDVAYSHRLKVDHGITIPLHKLAGGVARRPVLPIVINCAADPRPTFARVRALGEAVGEFLLSTGKRVAILGSGGLSHDPPTPRLGQTPAHVAERLITRHTPTREDLRARETRVMGAARALVSGAGPCMPPSESFDRRFLADLLAQDGAALDAYDDARLDAEAGFGSHEIRCWVAALAALRAFGAVEATLRYYAIVPEWITGMGIVEARNARDDGEAARATTMERQEA